MLAVVGGSPPGGGYRYALITLLGLAMGVQNAAARAIAVPDLTTTVLTLTITGIAADSSLGGGKGSRAGRRLVPVVDHAGRRRWSGPRSSCTPSLTIRWRSRWR